MNQAKIVLELCFIVFICARKMQLNYEYILYKTNYISQS